MVYTGSGIVYTGSGMVYTGSGLIYTGNRIGILGIKKGILILILTDSLDFQSYFYRYLFSHLNIISIPIMIF